MDEHKRVMVFGKNNIAIECTKVLLNNKRIQIIGCCPNNNDEGTNGRQKSFYKFCNEKDIKIFRFKKIRSEDSLKILKMLNLDFIFSFQYDQIINQNIIDVPKLGTINLHFSPLPKYRGVSPIAWALINGENEYGVTIHYMDAGIDTGDIISQTNFEIDSIKNAKELYNKCECVGKKLFSDTLEKLLDGNNRRSPQDNTGAIYYPNSSINFDECEINFKKSTYMLYNWIRAFIFPPFQYPIFQYEEEWKNVVEVYPIYDKNKFEKPGTLVKKNNNKFVFTSQDCYIKLKTEPLLQDRMYRNSKRNEQNSVVLNNLDDVKLGKDVKIQSFTNLYGCEVGDKTKIGTFVEIQKDSKIGSRCKISSHTFICSGVTIGDGCFIGHGVMFINDNYPQSINKKGEIEEEDDWSGRYLKTIVSNDVSIGSNATILGGITIGDCALIGAGAVVTKDVPSGAIVAGNPAKILRNKSGN